LSETIVQEVMQAIHNESVRIESWCFFLRNTHLKQQAIGIILMWLIVNSTFFLHICIFFTTFAAHFVLLCTPINISTCTNII
jgi:hypothetical protein